MLYEFIATHREVIIARTREKIAARSAPRATEDEIAHGVPLFLDQLAARLRSDVESSTQQFGESASRHGGELQHAGLTIGQVVHDYGNVCQAITELAVELKAQITNEDFRTLNMCLDIAIADAVTEYARRSDQAIVGRGVEQLGFLAHELRNLLNTATLAFDTIHTGSVASGGSTASLVANSLAGMRDLVTRSLAEVRLEAGPPREERIPIASVLEEIEITAAMQAKTRDVRLSIERVEADVAADGDSQILGSIVTNLVQNACKFTRAHGHVTLRTRVTPDRVLIDVADECGGLPPGKAEDLFKPYEQRSTDRSGLGLGLAISLKGARAIGGDIHVRNVPGTGCVFTVDLRKSSSVEYPRPGTAVSVTARNEAERTREGVRAALEAQRAGFERQTADAERLRLRELLKQVPAAINFLRGSELVFEFAHPNTLKALGGRDVLGKPLLEAIPEHRGQPFAEMLERVYRTGEPIVGKEMLAKLDRTGTGVLEESYWNFSYLPVRSPSGDVEGVMTFDIEVTDSVLAREQTQRALAGVESASRAKDEFLAMLGHELRNPLAPIQTALELLRLKLGTAGEREREVIERQVQHLVRLVDDLLDVSRIARGAVELRKQPVELSAVLAKAIETSAPLLEARQHKLTVSVPHVGLAVDADASRLEQVFSNLMTNAAKYMEPGGQITITAHRAGPDAIVQVVDQGIGIAADLLPRIFDLFVQQRQTLDRSRGGMGLGLAIVRNLVTLHGGTVTAHSDGRGRGSAFTVRLPALTVASTPPPCRSPRQSKSTSPNAAC